MPTISLSQEQQQFRNRILNAWLFQTFLFLKLPMAWVAGLKAKQLNTDSAEVKVKYKWITQNPFNSIYFAVLSMAAEMSTGLLVMLYIQDKNLKISMLVTGNEAKFTKKAVGTIIFKCIDGEKVYEAVEKAKTTKEGVEMNLNSIGYDEKQQEVAIFTFKWSIKVK
jgi:hypothetical protein